MNTEDTWKWDGLEINGFAKFNRLLRIDCAKARLTAALNEAPGKADPPAPTADIFLMQPGTFYTATQKHNEIIEKRNESFEQVISITLSRLDTVPAQRIEYIACRR